MSFLGERKILSCRRRLFITDLNGQFSQGLHLAPIWVVEGAGRVARIPGGYTFNRLLTKQINIWKYIEIGNIAVLLDTEKLVHNKTTGN